MRSKSFLKLEDVKNKFLDLFPTPPFTMKKKILAPPLTYNTALVGTAFDYLLRFLIEHSYNNTISTKWIAEDSLEYSKKMLKFAEKHQEKGDQNVKFVKKYNKKVKNIISIAKKEHSRFLSSGKITEKLLESTILLAQIDTIYRIKEININLGDINEHDITDLEKLISIVNLKNFKLKNACILNPRFGKAPKVLEGVDADLVIDDMLIDIKTIKNLEMRRDTYNQLIFYYTLYRLFGINGMKNGSKIKKLGIYFSRYGYLHLYDIEEIIDETKFSEFIEWFKKRLVQENGERR